LVLGTQLFPLKRFCAIPSKHNPTPLCLSRSGLVGYWVGCTALFRLLQAHPEEISCQRKQPNTIKRRRNITPTPRGIMPKRPSIMRAGCTKKQPITLTQLAATPPKPETTPKTLGKLTPRNTERNNP